MIRGVRGRSTATSALVGIILVSADAWFSACSYPEDYFFPSDDGGGSGATGSSGAGDDGGASGNAGDGAGSSSSGGGSGSTSSGSSSAGSSTGSGSSGGPSGDGGGPVVNPGVPGPMITFDDFTVPVTSNYVAAPGAICPGPDGRLWFLHQSSMPDAVGAITTDGQNVGMINISTTNMGPIGIAPGPDGNVWYTKERGIGKAFPSSLSSQGTVFEMQGGYQEYGVPMGTATGGIVQGPDGNMWFTGHTPALIGKMDMNGNAMAFPISGTNRTPGGITVGPDGNLWYADTSANLIGKITTSGTITEYPIPTPASFPSAITGGPKGDGNVWFVEHDAHNIGRITPSGVITEFAVPSGGAPGAITAGADGNLWFTEPGAFNAIGRCTPSGGISEYAIPTANTEVAGITSGPDGNIWFAEEDVAKIGRFSNLAGGGTLASSKVNPAPLGGLVGMCTKDTDCINSGMACGGDVCSHAGATPACVLANTGDPGWCNQSSDCWCNAHGATCDATSHHCSTTSLYGSDGG